MTPPQPGTLQYTIEESVSVSVKHTLLKLLITDGHTVRANTRRIPKGFEESLPHGILVQLWQNGEEVPARRWRTVTQRTQQTTIQDSVDTLLARLQASATPDADDLLTSARQALATSGTLSDYQKINTMMQDMNERQLRQMVSFMLLILLNQSAGN